MPQLQIINRPPTFSEQLGQGLGAGLSQGFSETLQQGIGRYFERKQRQAMFEDLMRNLKSSKRAGMPMQTPAQAMGSEQKMPQANFPANEATNFSDDELFALNAIDPQLGKTAIELQKMGTKEKAEKYKATQELRSKINQEYKDAQAVKARLVRMKELNEKGNLTTPAAAHLLEKAGLPLGILKNPNSEEFDKLSRDLLKGISTYFPGRINMVEVENFLKTIPTLMNSQEGRERVINNLLSLLEPQEKAYKYKNEILSETGTPPYDLEDRITQRLEQDLSSLVDKFKGEEMIQVRSPDGRTGRIKKSDLEKAQKKGYKPL